jgi:hypothetical protein
VILDALAVIAFSLVRAILQLVPAYTLPTQVTSSAGSFGGAAGSVNAIFPVGTLALCLGAVIACRLFLFVWDLVISVYKLFPFKAT